MNRRVDRPHQPHQPHQPSEQPPQPRQHKQSFLDDQVEEDGFVIEDVDNCEVIKTLIRNLVRPQGYDPALSISFLEIGISL